MQPEMVEFASPGGLAIHAERVDVAVSLHAPVLEQDAELERRRGGAHEFLLVDTEQLMEVPDRRDGRFTHAHGADLLRLHERDVQDAIELLRQRGGRDPPRRTATGDDDAADLLVVQDAGS
jgi:hypothetical protein